MVVLVCLAVALAGGFIVGAIVADYYDARTRQALRHLEVEIAAIKRLLATADAECRRLRALAREMVDPDTHEPVEQ